MKISRGDVVITEIPGVHSITISDGLITIDDVGMVWTVEDLTQFRDALTAAIDIAQGGAINVRSKRQPRVFRESDACPDDLTKVTDYEGDVWDRVSGGWHLDGTVKSWNFIVQRYAPLTEVLDDDA